MLRKMKLDHLIINLSLVFLITSCARLKPILPAGKTSFIGHPTYTTRTFGGDLSDYGSHFGAKSGVDSPFFNQINYKIDLSLRAEDFIAISVDLTDSPPTEKHVSFTYDGWTETALFPGLEARSQVNFIATNLILVSVTAKNRSGVSRELAPKITLRDPRKNVRLLRCPDNKNLLCLKKNISFFKKPLNFFWASPAYLVIHSELIPEKSLTLGPEESKEIYYLASFSGESLSEAVNRAKGGYVFIDNDPGAVHQTITVNWKNFISSLPLPHTTNRNFQELYLMAATALRMNLYRPLNNMKHWGTLPSKGKWDNLFYTWDTAWHSLGISEFDVEKSEEVILNIFQTQQKNGAIGAADWDGMYGLLGILGSTAPNLGFSAKELYQRDPDKIRKNNFAGIVYQESKKWLRWWEKSRDKDRDGLFEYRVMGESGWDQSPRGDLWGGKKGAGEDYFYTRFGGILYPSRIIDFIDLNIYLYQYYLTMNYFARELGYPEEEIKLWGNKAATLMQRIEDHMWSEEKNGWYDLYREKENSHSFVSVNTPAIWWPAFLGRPDPQRARRVIEKHLLNPEEFFGPYPIPSVAYNEPTFLKDDSNWRGFIWLVTTYSAIQTLYKYGYDQDCKTLIERTLSMVYNQDELKGISEAYNPKTGKRRNHTFQFGWSSALIMEILLERYQRERYIFPATKEAEGYIENIFTPEHKIWLSVISGEYNLPHIHISAADQLPLLESKKIRITLTDPYKMLKDNRIKITLEGKVIETKIDNEYIFDTGVYHGEQEFN